MPLTSFTHVIRKGWAGFGSIPIEGTIVISGNTQRTQQISVLGGATDLEIAFPLPLAAVCSLYLVVTGRTTLLVKTNSPTLPDDTLQLAGGEPFAWTIRDNVRMPFATDIAALYLSNPAAFTVTLDIKILLNL